MLTLAQAQALLPGALLVGDGTVAFDRVHTNTRSLRPGDLFVALRGDRFDAHDFLAQARERGARASLAERGLAAAGLNGLQVANTYEALQGLAAAWRQRFDLPLIAVTGSNGKTTVTQMVAAILQAWLGEGALATQGNLNNHIGVPLTLLRLRQDALTHHRAAVVELGMNHPGEIALLARLAAPTVALVNNAQREHQEFMDGLEAVARENGAALEALPAGGVAVFPADDPQAEIWRAQAGQRRVLTFALTGPADITAQVRPQGAGWALRLHTPASDFDVTLDMAGRHNVHNALAATACALAAGVPVPAIQQGLADFRPVKGRSQVSRLDWGGQEAVLVDDTYNANPDSVLAAIEVLHGLSGPRWLILGDMGEVGAQGPAFHAEVGERARARALDHVWCVGPLSRHAAQAAGACARHFETVEALLQALTAPAPAGPRAPLPVASILVKGSRFMALERVVEALRGLSEAGGRHAA